MSAGSGQITSAVPYLLVPGRLLLASHDAVAVFVVAVVSLGEQEYVYSTAVSDGIVPPLTPLETVCGSPLPSVYVPSWTVHSVGPASSRTSDTFTPVTSNEFGFVTAI